MKKKKEEIIDQKAMTILDSLYELDELQDILNVLEFVIYTMEASALNQGVDLLDVLHPWLDDVAEGLEELKIELEKVKPIGN